MFKYLTVFAFLVVSSQGGCREARPERARAAPPAIAVRVAPVERVERARPVLATGMLAAKAEVRASFKLGGLIRTILVDEGAVVRKGQVLASLATTEVDATVEQARQGVTKALRDRESTAMLVERRAATGTQLDDATTGLAVARAQLRAAEFNRAHAVIRAPRAGRVLRRLAEPDELVAAGQPVLVLAGDENDWVLRVALADRDVVRLREGDPASLRFTAWPDAEPLLGVVSELASAATVPLGTYEVELRVQPAGRALRAGLVAHVTIAPSVREAVSMIPAVALREGDGHTAAVWVPTPTGTVVRRTVETAYFDGANVAVKAGLDGVTQVITDGAPYLTTGSTIAVSP